MAFRSRSKKIGRDGSITTPGQIQKAGVPAFKVRSNNGTAAQTGTWVWTVEDFSHPWGERVNIQRPQMQLYHLSTGMNIYNRTKKLDRSTRHSLLIPRHHCN